MTTRPTLANSVHLDLVRGMAALAVLIAHLRIIAFVDYSDNEVSSPMVAAWYFLTGFSHQAVLVFFVLSGFFITSTAVRNGSNSWSDYAIDRGTRLYIVIIPCLLVTLAADSLGLTLSEDARIYERLQYPYGDSYRPIDARDPGTFAGNLAFLQGIAVRPYGSNSPLWSLGFECCYYVLLPLILQAASGRVSWQTRCGCGLLAIGIMLAAAATLPLLPVWLMGAMIRILPAIGILRSRMVFLVVSGLTVAILVASRLSPESLIGDYFIGLSATAWIYVLLHLEAPASAGIYRTFSSGLASFSFTLYAVHLPLIVAFTAIYFQSHRQQPTLHSAAAAFGASLGVIAFAWLLARGTERQTSRIRRWVRTRCGLGIK